MDKDENQTSGNEDLYVVGLGASAGGLDAISKFLANFNGASAEFCVVIVMHLSPDYKSELTSILSKRCRWPVHTVSKQTKLEARNVYVTPQNCDLHVDGNHLILDSLPSDYAHAPSIDHFFTSLAKAKKRKAFGIILSGFGHDGTEGLREIKKQGGFAIAQLPETAEHRDMPQSAINSDMIDVTIPAEQMYDEIVQYIDNSHTIEGSLPAKKSIDAIFELLEKRSGTDFSLYKPSTIMRRINHRMNNLQVRSLVDYYALIKKSPKELDILFETVLIGVTEFYRDVKAFESLKKELQERLSQKKPGDSIRIWCVGCATGEEPYSIAILLNEILRGAINQFHVQIFASDIDERALNFARKGIYRKDSLKNLDQKIIDKYFFKKGETHYELIKEIKQHTLFTRHDISNDPPFVKLDVVVCRNLLIYFNNELQKQSLQIFHYSLRPKGLLFLGKSESVSQVADLFKKSNVNKLFHKADSSLNYELRFSRFKSQHLKVDKEHKKGKKQNMTVVEAAKETLYYKYQFPFVIINDNAEIKEVNGSLRMYLEIGQGTMNANLYKMVNPELVTVLKGVHAQVRKTGVQHVSQVVKFDLYDNDHFVRINVLPLIYALQEMQYYIVIFEKVEPSEQVLELQKKLDTADFVDLRVKELEDELSTTKEHLQIFTEELEATNEELQTINEELQSANEELKSSNEELETSNEELQSANEELNTANYELRVTNEAFIEKERELNQEKTISERNELIYRSIAENIPDGAIGILNKDFKVEYIAGQGLDLLGEEDLKGAYMPALNTDAIEQKKLEEMCEKVLSGEKASTEVYFDNRYYDVKAVPIDLPDSIETKILYLAIEVTNLKNNQFILETALEASNLIVFHYDFKKNEIHPDNALSDFLELPRDQPLRMDDIENVVHPDDIALSRENLKKSQGTGKIDYEVRMLLKSGIKYVRITGKILFDNEGDPAKSFATLLDITEDKHLLLRVKESEKRFKSIAEAAPVTIWVSDKDKNCTYVNAKWLEYTGSTLEDNLGKGFFKFVHPDDQANLQEIFADAFDKKESFTHEYRVIGADNRVRWFVNTGKPIVEDDGEFIGYIGTNIDITDKKLFTEKLEAQVVERTKELKEANEELSKANLNLEEYAYVASHDLQEPIRKIRMFNSLIVEHKGDQEKIDRYNEKIEELANRMTILIKDILVYGKLSTEDPDFKPVDLDLIIRRLTEDLDDVLKEKKVELNTQNLGQVKGNETYLYQLFINLIRNSIKFTTDRPQIHITAETVSGSQIPTEIEVDRDQKFKKISFIDNGIGIDPKDFDAIFKPFKRLNGSNEFPGTGVGLSICKRIVEMHNGYITLKSEKDKGTTFVVFLPA